MLKGSEESLPSRMLPSSRKSTRSTATVSVASALTVTIPPTEALAAGAVTPTVGGTVSTVMATGGESPGLPAWSKARASSVCPPSAALVASQAMLYGAVSSLPSTTSPSSTKSTRSIPTSSVASALRVMTEPTTAPGAGAVMTTTGATGSTVTVTAAERV